MKPETVIRWRERKFQEFWRRKSQGSSGRPAIPHEHIAFIRRISSEFIRWYNHGRVHQELSGISDPDPAIEGPEPLGGRLVAIPVLNGLHHDYRMAA